MSGCSSSQESQPTGHVHLEPHAEMHGGGTQFLREIAPWSPWFLTESLGPWRGGGYLHKPGRNEQLFSPFQRAAFQKLALFTRTPPSPTADGTDNKEPYGPDTLLAPISCRL